MKTFTNFSSFMKGCCQGIASYFGTRLLRFDSLSLVSRQSVLAILVACLTLGVGNAWGEDSGLTASPGVFILDFYDSSKLSSTSGTALTTSNCRSNFTKVPDGVKSDGTDLTASTIISGISNSGTVQYGKNGGLTFGTSSTGKHQTTISVSTDFLIRKITAVGTLYDNSVPLYVNGTSVSLNTKGTAYASCSKSTTITPNFISSFVVKQNNGSNKGRSTLYTLVCEYGYRAYLTSPATGSISAAPKTAKENGAGWNSTEGAVVGLKASQKVTLTATPPSGYELDAWTIKKKSDNSDVTTTLLGAGNSGKNPVTLTMASTPYDVTVSVTWKSVASCTADPTVGSVSLNGSFLGTTLFEPVSPCVEP